MKIIFALLFCVSLNHVLADNFQKSWLKLNSLFNAPQDAPVQPPKEKIEPALPAISKKNLHETIAYLSSDKLEGRAPLTEGSKLAQDFIIERMKRYGLEPAGEKGGWLQSVKKNFWGDEIGKNILGILKGAKNPDECVYVVAHYDHWGKATGKIQPGANDNASGVAMMLEAARLLSGTKPDRSIVFLAPDYEEGAAVPMMGGIKGSAYHVKNPVCPKEKIKAALVMDMVGGRFIEGMPASLFLMGSESSASLYSMAQKLTHAKRQEPVVQALGIYAIEPYGKSIPRSDYGPFRDAGIPFIFATSGIPPEYHTPQDTLDKINFDYMTRAGSVILSLTAQMASKNFEISRKEARMDWDEEARVLGRIADILTELDLDDKKAPYAAGVLELTEELEAKLPKLSRREKAEAVQSAMSKAVLTLIEMNGSLRFWEHIIRDH